MLIKESAINAQRHYDSLHFNKSHHCDTAIEILRNDCLYLKSRNITIFLSENEVEKLEAIRPLLENTNLEQLKNITELFNKPTVKQTLTKLELFFNKKFGWFFKNGNKS